MRLKGTIGFGTEGDDRNESLRATGNIAVLSRPAGRLALLPALFAAFAFLFFVLAGPAASQADASTNLTATVTIDNKVYNGNDTAAINGCQLNGVDPVNPQVFCDISSATATFAQANAGTWLVSVSDLGLTGSDAGLYTLNPTTATATAQITPKPATALVTAENKTYDASNAATASCSVAADVILGDTVNCNIGSATFDNQNVGTGKTVTASGINLTGAQSGNYALTSNTETTTANIDAKTISATVSASSKTYNGNATASATCTPTGVESGDTVTCAVGSATFDDKNVGTGKTVTVSGMTLGGAQAGNYILSPTSDETTANITAKTISATVSATTKVYDGTDTASATCTPNGVESGDTVTCAVGSATFAGTNVGTYTVTATGMTLSGGDATNYVLSPTTGTDTAAITARPLTANVSAANKVYDGNNTATLTGCTLGNVVSGEDVTCVTGGSTATFASTGVANGIAVNVTGLTLGGTATLSNYSFTGAAATTANITPKSLTVTTTANNKLYDGTTAATLASCAVNPIGQIVGSDTVTCDFAAATAAFANANVGNGKAVNVTSLPLDGAQAGNYTVNLASAATTADITPATLTATIQAANKVYDGNVSATLNSCQLVGVIAPDAVTCVTTGATTTFDNKNAGTGKTVTATGLTLGGPQAGNYSFAGSATNTADITPKTLTATVIVANKVYNTNTTGSIDSCTLTGVVSGETVTCDTATTPATATFNNKNVGTNKPVDIAGLAQAGADSGANYSLSATTTSTANITAAPISVTSVSASNKAYDGNTTASATCTVTPIGADVLGCAVGAANFVNASVGGPKTVNITGMTLTGTDAGNYNLSPTTATTTADITAKALTAEIFVQTKTYNGSAAATITACQLDGIAPGEEVTCNFGAASASFADANAQVGKATSATGLTLSGVDAGSYTFSGNGTGTGTITPKTVTASITVSNKTYNGNTTASLTGCTLTGVVVGETVTCNTGSATATFNNKNVGTNKPVTASGLTLVATSPALTGNYSFSGSATGSADITAKTITATVTASGKVYDGNNTASASCTPTGLESGDNVTCGVGSATFAGTDVGSYTVTATGMTLSGTDATNYVLSSTTGTDTASITVRPLTATVTAGNKVYDQTTAATLASCSLGNVVSGEDVFCVTGGSTATFASANVANGIAVNVSGLTLGGGATLSNYSFAGTAATTADITPKILTAVTTAASKVYDANTTATLSACALSGVLNPDVVVCDFAGATASFATADVGTNKTVTVSNLPLTGADAGNYAFGPATITAVADITVKSATPTLIAENKTYDGNATATSTCTSADFVPGDTVGCSVGAASFDNKNVGNGKPVNATGLALTGTSAGNYSLTATTAATTADITPKVLIATITVADKVYDGNTSATITSCTPDGVVSPDVVTCVTTGATATFSSKNAGTGKSVSATGLTLSGADVGNYFFVGTGFGTAAITPKVVTPAITANSKVYDGNVTTTALCSIAADVVGGDTVDCTDVTAFFNNPAVGTNKTVNVAGIALSGPDAGNYSLSSTSTTGTADITPKPVVPTVTASNKQYDGNTDATITGCSLTGVLVGETATCGAASGSFANAAVANGKTVTAAGVALSGANAGNYVLTTTTPTTTANITPKQITASVTANNKQYNNSTTATIASCEPNNLVGSETVTCSAPTATFNNKNAGTDKPVTATGITLGGANAANYTLSPNTATTSANITQAPVTAVVADAQNKVYDGNTTATVNGCALLGLLGADVANCSVTTANFANKDVGNGKTVTATAFSLSGADGGNYNVSGPATTTANITAKALTPSVTASNKVYDGNTDATAACTLAGAVVGDTVDCTIGAADFNNKNVGTAKPVSATGLGVTGADASNYSLSSTTAGTTANISAKGLTADITAANKPYDGNDEATITSCTLDGVVSGEDVTCDTAGATATFNNRNPGDDKPVQATGLTLSGTDAGPNYLFNGNASTTADITAGTLTAAVTVQNKVYDGNATATVTGCSLTGVVPGDTVGCDFAAAQASFNNKNVGNGKGVSVTGLTLTGADKDEYQFNGTASGTADITQKAVTGATVVVNERPFNGDVNATIASCSVQGILSGDTVECVTTGATATFANPGPGADIPVTATGLSLGGADAANYSFNGQATGVGTIDPRASLSISLAKTGTLKVPTNRKVQAGRVSCVVGNCTIKSASASVRVGKKVVKAGVSFSKAAFGPGANRVVTVIVPKSSFKALKKRKKGLITLTVKAESQLPLSSDEAASTLKIKIKP